MEVEKPQCHALVLIYVLSLILKITGMVSLNRARKSRQEEEVEVEEEDFEREVEQINWMTIYSLSSLCHIIHSFTDAHHQITSNS